MSTHELAMPRPSPGVRNQQFWRDHIDKVAVQRVQTPDRLITRRDELIAAISRYLLLVSVEAQLMAWKAQPKVKKKPGVRSRLRSSGSTYNRARGQLKTAWGCNDAWLNITTELGQNFDHAPTTRELYLFLQFPLPTDVSSSRPHRKKFRAQ